LKKWHFEPSLSWAKRAIFFDTAVFGAGFVSLPPSFWNNKFIDVEAIADFN